MTTIPLRIVPNLPGSATYLLETHINTRCVGASRLAITAVRMRLSLSSRDLGSGF
jgi:hypothetical protein